MRRYVIGTTARDGYRTVGVVVAADTWQQASVIAGFFLAGERGWSLADVGEVDMAHFAAGGEALQAYLRRCAFGRVLCVGVPEEERQELLRYGIGGMTPP